MPQHIESKTVTVTYSGSLNFKAAFLNHVRLRFRNDSATVGVNTARSHQLKWEVLGVPGAKWAWKLEAEEGFRIDPVELEKDQSNELQKPAESPPAISFRIVAKN